MASVSVRPDSFLFNTKELVLDLGGSGGDSSSDDTDDCDNERVSMTTEPRLVEWSILSDEMLGSLS